MGAWESRKAFTEKEIGQRGRGVEEMKGSPNYSCRFLSIQSTTARQLGEFLVSVIVVRAFCAADFGSMPENRDNGD